MNSRLKEAGLAVGGLVLGAGIILGGQELAKKTPSVDANTGNTRPGAELIDRSEASQALEEESTLENAIEFGSGLTITGFPENVDRSTVDVARGVFRNTIGLGSEMVLAEPGALHVGSDFESDATRQNPYGANPDGWGTMYSSNGHIDAFSPVNQEVITSEEPFYWNLPEGGFVFFSGGRGTIEIGFWDENGEWVSERSLNLEAREGHNWHVIIRGLYPDGEQNSDRNRTLRITGVVPGHAIVESYDGGFNSESGQSENDAFLSEEDYLQRAQTSHSAGTNCGAEGCSDLTLVAADHNTGALATLNHEQGRYRNPARGWEAGNSNWR